METKGTAPATPATERRQRTPLAVTRERVLGIAERMFRQSGVQAVSVDAIAQAAGIKKMTLYRCFPSKEELVLACMDQWEAAFRRIWDQAQDQYPNEPARQLLAFFQSIHELVSQPGYSGNVFMHLMTDYTDPEHHICVRVREQRASLRADVRNLLAKAEAPDPDQLAELAGPGGQPGIGADAHADRESARANALTRRPHAPGAHVTLSLDPARTARL